MFGTNGIREYYQERLGNNYTFFLLLGGACFLGVVITSSIEAHYLNNNKSKTDFGDYKNIEEWFIVLAVLTGIAAVCTLIDFDVVVSKDKSVIDCRITPITIATGSFATFLGVALWTLNAKKNFFQTTTLIFIFQTIANSIQLAAIFNTPDDKFPLKITQSASTFSQSVRLL